MLTVHSCVQPSVQSELKLNAFHMWEKLKTGHSSSWWNLSMYDVTKLCGMGRLGRRSQNGILPDKRCLLIQQNVFRQWKKEYNRDPSAKKTKLSYLVSLFNIHWNDIHVFITRHGLNVIFHWISMYIISLSPVYRISCWWQNNNKQQPYSFSEYIWM